MFKHVLIPTDGSKTAEKAVQAGIDFARDSKARITAFTAMPTFPMPSRNQLLSGKYENIDKYEEKAIAKGKKLLEQIVKLGRENALVTALRPTTVTAPSVDAAVNDEMPFGACLSPGSA